MAKLRNVVYLTKAQKDILFTPGGTVGGISYDANDLYIVLQLWDVDGSASDYFYIKDFTGVERVRVSNNGMVRAAGFEGSGALLTNLSASSITSGTIDVARLPAIAITDRFVYNTPTDFQTAYSANHNLLQKGDVVIFTTNKETYIHNGGTAWSMDDLTKLETPTDLVASVNGKAGVVVIGPTDITWTSSHRTVTDTEKYTWNNKSDAHTHPYLSSTHDAKNVTAALIGQWNAAYGWGNHASAGYAMSGHNHNTVYLGIGAKAADSTLANGLVVTPTGTRNNIANQVVTTDASGYANFGWINTTSGNTTNPITDVYVNTNDGYIRKKTLALFKAELGTMSPTSHIHGNITNDGKIGSTADQVVVTGTAGALTTLSRSGIDSRTSFPTTSSTHNHDDRYYTETEIQTSNIYMRKLLVNPTGVPSNNLGDPTIAEMALFQEQFNNKTAFYDVSKIKFYTSPDNSTWTELTIFTTAQKQKFVGGDFNSGILIPNQTAYFRIEIQANAYVYLNALYMYWSSQSHSTKVKIWKKEYASQVWSQHTNSDALVSSWPGHLFLPFQTIPFGPGHFDAIRIEFEPTWNLLESNAYKLNPIFLDKMQIWGGYPAGKRTVYEVNELAEVTFPAKVTAPTFVGALTGTASGNLLNTHAASGVTTTLIGQWNNAYTHSGVAHAPSNAQKNSDITKAEIEAKLTGAITTHTHAYRADTWVPSASQITGLDTTHKWLTDAYISTWNAKSDAHTHPYRADTWFPAASEVTGLDATHRWLTDAYISTWNAKSDAHTHPYLSTSHAASGVTNTRIVEWDAAYTHSDVDHAPSNAQANVIETIKVNGVALTPVSKAVDISTLVIGPYATNAAAGNHTHSASGLTVGTAKLLGRISAGTGGGEELSQYDVRTFLGLGDAAYTNASAYLSSSHAASGVTAERITNWTAAYNHTQVAHAPSNAQKNSDITKAEIEAKLTGTNSYYLKGTGTTTNPVWAPLVELESTATVSTTFVSMACEANQSDFMLCFKTGSSSGPDVAQLFLTTSNSESLPPYTGGGSEQRHDLVTWTTQIAAYVYKSGNAIYVKVLSGTYYCQLYAL